MIAVFLTLLASALPNPNETLGTSPGIAVQPAPDEEPAVALPSFTAVVFTPGGQQLLAAGDGRLEVRGWPDLELHETLRLNLPAVHDLVFSADGTRLAIAGGRPGEYGAVEVWNWPEATVIARNEQPADVVYAVTWTAEDRLMTASADHTLGDWSLSSERFEIWNGHSRAVRGLAVLDEQWLASAGLDNSVRTWNRATGVVRFSRANHRGPVQDLALQPSDSGLPLIATAGSDRTVRLWQPTIGRHLRFATLPAAVTAIDWQVDGRLLLAVATDGHLYVIDPQTVEIRQRLTAVDGWAFCLAAGPQPGTAVVAGRDGQIVRVEYQP